MTVFLLKVAAKLLGVLAPYAIEKLKGQVVDKLSKESYEKLWVKGDKFFHFEKEVDNFNALVDELQKYIKDLKDVEEQSKLKTLSEWLLQIEIAILQAEDIYDDMCLIVMEKEEKKEKFGEYLTEMIKEEKENVGKQEHLETKVISESEHSESRKTEVINESESRGTESKFMKESESSKTEAIKESESRETESKFMKESAQGLIKNLDQQQEEIEEDFVIVTQESQQEKEEETLMVQSQEHKRKSTVLNDKEEKRPKYGISKLANISEIPSKWQIMGKIKDFETKVKTIVNEADRLKAMQVIRAGITTTSVQERILGCKTKPNLYNPDHAVGIKEKVEALEFVLKEKRVVAVVGMAGLGKTLLLRHVYNSYKEQKGVNYSLVSWLSMSPEFSLNRMQTDLWASIRQWNHGSLDIGMSDTAFAEMIFDRLKEEVKCLIVIDDIWDVPYKLIQELALPDNCDIIFSTRDNRVAQKQMDIDIPLESKFIYKMTLLSADESWALFRLKAQIVPEDLRDLGMQIVQACHRHPLTLEVVGRMLAGKPEKEWIQMHRRLMSCDVTNNITDDVIATLNVTYERLFPEAKPCFVYMGCYPYGFEEDASELAIKWVQEGMVKSMEFANEIIEDLENVHLIQYEEVEPCRKVIRMHHVPHSLSKQLFVKNGGLFINGKAGTGKVDESKGRRVIIKASNIQEIILPETCRHAHIEMEGSDKALPRSIFSKAKSIRHLSIKGNVSYFPAVDLKYVRCLHINSIEYIPSVVHKMRLLISLRVGAVTEFPNWLGDLSLLEELCHSHTSPRKAPKSFRFLKNLQRIRGFIEVMLTENDEVLSITELGGLTQLKELALYIDDDNINQDSENESFPILPELEKFSFEFSRLGFDFTDVHIKLPSVTEILIMSSDKDFPTWLADMKGVKRAEVWLYGNMHHTVPISKLQHMEELRLLCLNFMETRSFETGSFEIGGSVQDGGFPKLQHLIFAWGNLTKSFSFSVGSLPNLENFSLNHILINRDTKAFELPQAIFIATHVIGERGDKDVLIQGSRTDFRAIYKDDQTLCLLPKPVPSK